MAINSGTLHSYNIAQSTSNASNVGADADVRKLYNFGDRIAELAPEESPFFVYLNKVAKTPTDDPVFRYLENRTQIDWTSRNFYVFTSSPSIGTVAAGTDYTFWVDDGTSASIDWLVKGMVFSCNTADDTNGWAQAIFRIGTSPTDAGAYTSFTAKCVSLSNTNVSGYNAVQDNDQCQVIGTSFAEGSGSPDVWSGQIEDNFGYTQIFKTSAELTNTAIATVHRGYANEWDRIWALKLREHKIDIERAMLFSQKARQSSIQYTEGILGHIVTNTNPVVDDSSLSYSSGKAYYRSVAQSEMTYDRLLSDFEVVYDPARGGGSEKLGLASLPVISFFNKLGRNAFLAGTMQSANKIYEAGSSGVPTEADGSPAVGDQISGSNYSFNLTTQSGKFGHQVYSIDTIHGSLHLLKEPLFRGISSGTLLCADMANVAYRPLVGNGVNRDTHVITNVQSDDEDLRKDMIVTEAGLEITLPETHLLYNMEGL